MVHRIARNIIRTFSGSMAVLGFVAAGGFAGAQALLQPLGGIGSQSTTIAAGKTPQGVATADFNHDGYADLVVANYADTSLGTNGTISVYLSSGPGTFQAPTKYPTCGGPTAVLATDLNLTGSPDIVVTCNTPTSNVIEVFLNALGNGTFTPTVNGTTNIVLGTNLDQPVAITAGDFNGDGHPDLAVANKGNGTVSLFLSDAADYFTTFQQQTISGLGTPTAITTGRFDASGNLGLAVADATGKTVHILKGDGKGGFTVAGSFATGSTPNGIVTADFNGDGLPDLATTNAGDGTVTVLTGTGNDQFTSANYPIGPASGTGGESIVALDVNGDGHIDLISANPIQGVVAILQNNGNGTFQAAQNYPVPNGPAYLAPGDFHRSGKLDLAVSQQSGSSITVLANNTLPTPTHGGLNFFTPNTLTAGSGNMADGIAIADFNGDGKPDRVASYLEDNSVRVSMGLGGGNFQSPAVTYAVGKLPYSVATGDLNLDGYADIITANTADGTVSVLMNNGGGSGTFAAQQTYKVGRDPMEVAVGDLNGDGIPDLAVTNMADNTVTVLYGPLTAGVPTVQTLQTCANPYGVTIGDFRHTGQNDLAVTCFGSAQMEVFLNGGMLPEQPPTKPTTFMTPLMLSTESEPTSIVVGDFNRDGKLDIVTGDATANSVSFFAGNGDGTFAAAVNSFALNFPVSIAAGDVNGDGILDLVTVAPNFNQVAILLGKGDGTFLQRTEFAAGTQPWAAALADFNSDGRLDIATANTVNRVNLTTPAKQLQYIREFPPTATGAPSLNVLLNSSGTTTSLSGANGQKKYDSPVTFSATVAPDMGSTVPTGSVVFEDSNGMMFPGGSAPLAGGTATKTVPILGSGSHQITVLYSGDANYRPQTTTGPNFVVNVGGTYISLTLSTNSAPYGSTVSYSAVVGTPGDHNTDPSGTVSLYVLMPNGSAVLAGTQAVTGNGNGTATSSGSVVNILPPGTYYLYAIFTPTKQGFFKAGSSSEVEVTSTP